MASATISNTKAPCGAARDPNESQVARDASATACRLQSGAHIDRFTAQWNGTKPVAANPQPALAPPGSRAMTHEKMMTLDGNAPTGPSPALENVDLSWVERIDWSKYR
jgi:hypothetical protein